MSVTPWLRSHAPGVLLVGFLLAAGGTVAAAGVGLAALATGTDLLVAFGVTVAAVATLGTLAVVLFGALVWTVVGRLLGTTGRGVAAARRQLADAVAAAETRSDRLAGLDVSRTVAPADYDPVLDGLKRQYVDGELSELGFERRLDRLLADDRIDPEQARAVRADAAFDRDLERELERERERSRTRTHTDATDRDAPIEEPSRVGDREFDLD